MANVLIFNVFLALIVSGVESCNIPSSLYVPVAQTIWDGQYITTVEGADCDFKSVNLTEPNSHFKIYSDGIVEASATVTVPPAGRTFSVSVVDNTGHERLIAVHLFHDTTSKSSEVLLKRSKRRWSPNPFKIKENNKGPYPMEIERILSDAESNQDVYYTLSGQGVDMTPLNVFSINKDTGMLSVNSEVDREQYPKFTLITRVYNTQTNQEVDKPLDIEVLVEDLNDNAPVFKDQMQYTVPEKSKSGTTVGKVTSEDRDQEGTDHVKVKYSLLTGQNQFSINSETGIITTKTDTLDREVQETYTAVVQIKDMNGRPNGLSNSATATITLTDINDHPPTFLSASYKASVKENERGALILKIPVEDKDLINTPNWKSKFVITKGNENGNFRIDTDPKTNNGLLYVTKELDFEKSPIVNLEIMARNEAELQGTTAQWLSVPVNVAVGNIDEGPEFIPPSVTFKVKENTPNGTLIGTYKALDPETKSSNGMKYYKITDPASWVNYNRDSGELKVANTIDRESNFVQNGTYIITVRAVDPSSKTGTGTVTIVVEDVNDNFPKLPSREQVMCKTPGGLSSMVVTAEDKDQMPFSAPFSFSLPTDGDGKWSLTRFNDTAATLKQLKELPTGIYNVPMEIKDLQGSGETQMAKVRICECRNGVCLTKPSSVVLGPLGILTLLLPLALLLLLGLLLALFCSTERPFPTIDDLDNGGILLKSNTEARGEEVDASLITVPIAVNEPGLKGPPTVVNGAMQEIKGGSVTGGFGTKDVVMYETGASAPNCYAEFEDQVDRFYGTQYEGGQLNFDSRYLTQDASFLHTWQTNGRYLQQKLPRLGMEDDGRFANDIIHSYGYEGVGSAAGSVGCCSDFGDNDNLDFLNTLGPKFKSLAQSVQRNEQ